MSLLFSSFIRSDSEGNGNFGSSRGGRIHNGVDFATVPGQFVLSPVNGNVTKIGYPYADDLSYRYVEITDHQKWRHRFFYVEPLIWIKPSRYVIKGEPIGISQNVSKRYSDKMIPHVHYEIKLPDDTFVNPMLTTFADKADANNINKS